MALIFGTTGNDTRGGTNDSDTIYGGPNSSDNPPDFGADFLFGEAGNDVLVGFGGDDILLGGIGDDVLEGGEGSDTASYETASVGVRVRLSQATPQVTEGAGLDQLIDIENILGSGHDDILTGNDGANRLRGGAGVDTLRGGLGLDTLEGGKGDDIYHLDIEPGATSHDVIVEEADGGTDTVYFQSGNYTLADHVEIGIGFGASSVIQGNDGPNIIFISTGETFGTAGAGGNDLLIGNGSKNRILGGQGDDAVVGAGGDDTLTGESGADLLFGGSFAVDGSFVANSGKDRLEGGEGNDGLWGADGEDTLKGDAGNDALVGGAERDSIFGGEGDDFLFGGEFSAIDGSRMPASGADYLDGGPGRDALYGFDGDDQISCSEGDDYVEAGEGADIIAGETSNDTLLGQDGDDLISGDAGFDYLYGGGGADKFFIGKGYSYDTVWDFSIAQGDGLTVRVGLGVTNFAQFKALLTGFTFEGVAYSVINFAAFGSNDQITIAGIAPNEWTAAMVEFST